jgi:uncharacterized membrane protein YedE/YeeE
MSNFTPLSSFAGGTLIGVAAALLLVGNGRIAGVSGIVAGLLRRPAGDTTWRALFVAGLLAGGLVLQLTRPSAIGPSVVGFPLLVVAGLLVGFGTQLGSGCTSGHGVCGIGRLSPRSMVATATFMLAGAATTYVLRHLLGGGS